MAEVTAPTPMSPMQLATVPVTNLDGTMQQTWLRAMEDLKTIVQDLQTRVTALEEASP